MRSSGMTRVAEPASAPRPARFDGVSLGLYAVTVFSWGFSWIAVKAQLGFVPPEVSVLWRFVLAAAVMWLVIGWRRLPWRFDLATHLRFALLGLFLFSMNFALFYHGAKALPSGLMAVVFSLASVMNMLLGALLLRQPIEGRVALAGVMGFSGVGLMFLPELGMAQAGVGLGLGLCAAGTLVFCFGNLVSSRLQARGVPVMSANAWGMVYGSALLLAWCELRGLPLVIEPTRPYLGGLAFLAVFASVVAFTSYLTLLGRIGAARAGYVTVLFPIVALAVSTLVEGYVWTISAVVGAALAFAGNVLILRRPAAR